MNACDSDTALIERVKNGLIYQAPEARDLYVLDMRDSAVDKSRYDREIAAYLAEGANDG